MCRTLIGSGHPAPRKNYSGQEKSFHQHYLRNERGEIVGEYCTKERIRLYWR